MLLISLIVCSRGRPVFLERMLLGVALLRDAAFELIVIIDPNDLETSECLARHAPGARIGYCGAANLAKARNIGLSMACGDVVAFLDDDAVPEPDWLDRLAQAYSDPDIMAAGGFIRAQDGVRFQCRAVIVDPFGADHRRARIPRRLPAGWFVALTGTNFSVRRVAALALGGFDEIYAYFLEETDFLFRLQRAGGQVCVVGGAEVHHAYAASDVRDAHGVPKSLWVIARSKAYFCHVNRRPETPLFEVAAALRKFARRKRYQIQAHLRAGRISAQDAARLLAELHTGLEAGETRAKAGRSMMALSAMEDKEFELYRLQHQQMPRQRLCVLLENLPPGSPEWPVLRGLARSGYEVTVIYFGASLRHRVIFADGIWEHQLPVVWRLFGWSSRRAMRAEMRRISPHRCFEKIYVASGDAALENVAAGSGLQRFMPIQDRR